MLEKVRRRTEPWDVLIIGGGSTGIGCALDAATRGLKVLLLEQHDFGKGTSSRSTKLIHGGVRYLEQGNLSLVREALRERGLLKKNAPHHIKKQAFIIPCYSLWRKYYYGLGLKIYDLLSGPYSFGKSRILAKSEIHEKLPNTITDNLVGGVSYFDGQFDDTRLLIDIAKTAAGHGAILLNYARVFGFGKSADGKIDRVNFECSKTGEQLNAECKTVINATGAFCDNVRSFSGLKSEKLVTPSQGIHLVFDQSFLKSKSAMMIPKTSDGRVLFVIPWHGKTLVGTTDTPIESAKSEPKPLEEEIEFILETCKSYLAKSPKRDDILSTFAGVRPLVNSSSSKNTASLSRDHMIEIDESGLISITGGKWTTYRRMAEDTVNQAVNSGNLSAAECVTEDLKIDSVDQNEASDIAFENRDFSRKLHKDFPYLEADVVNGTRNEMAQTIEDILARRTRILFLDAKAAVEISRRVAEIMAKELGENDDWVENEVREFALLAENYLYRQVITVNPDS